MPIQKSLLFACSLLVSVNALSSEQAFISSSKNNSAYLVSQAGVIESALTSPSGKFHLIMQTDGRLALYQGSSTQDRTNLIWSENGYRGPGNYFLNMQNDGNLAVWTGIPSTPSAIPNGWSSGTPGKLGNYFLMVQDDGNVVVYRGSKPQDNHGALWSRLTGVIPLALQASDERIPLGNMSLGPTCTKTEWNQVYNATTRIGSQKVTAFLHIDKKAIDRIQSKIVECAKAGAAAATLAAIYSAPVAAMPAFKTAFNVCLAASQVDTSISDSISLSTQTDCDYH